jgi:hypothetical protein
MNYRFRGNGAESLPIALPGQKLVGTVTSGVIDVATVYLQYPL